MAELVLDHAKQILNLGADTGLQFRQLLAQRIDRAALVHGLVLARHHGNLRSVLLLNFVTLLHTPEARVGKDNFFRRTTAHAPA